MRYTVSAPDVPMHAAIRLPASKSISNRALILHALAHGRQALCNLSDCDDTRVMVRALQGNPEHIDIMAAGTAMRFLTAYLSVTPGVRIITGTQRMQQRPIRILTDALRQLGANIEYAGNEGFPPLRITGSELQGCEISLAGNVSSQYISALLMIGAVLPQGLHLYLTGCIISRPYIDLTLKLIRDFGGCAEWSSENSITVYPGGYRDVPFTVESDWSAASYWYQILALRGNEERKTESGESPKGNEEETVELLGLFPHSYQGDSRGAEIFSRLGVHTEYTDKGVRLTLAGTPVDRLEEDMVDIPDLAQTDRITALIAELRKLGYAVRSEQDSILLWEGERCPAESAPVIATYEDHRMAMAFAPACIALPQIRIDEPQVVSKSYPGYWEDLKQAGFIIRH